MSVHTGTGTWVVPSEARSGFHRKRSTRSRPAAPSPCGLSISDPDWFSLLPQCCFVLHVSPLLREIVLHIFRLGFLYNSKPRQARLASVLVDQIDSTDEVPLHLHLPTDPRALRIAEMLFLMPEKRAPLDQLARESGASPRKLERLFRLEVWMMFGQWRRQVRNARMTVTSLLAVADRLKPLVRQRETEAAMVATCLESGGQGPSFWPWTMSGPNALTERIVGAFFRYDQGDRIAHPGELVRVDIGCAGGGYGADVGRTLPCPAVSLPARPKPGISSSPATRRGSMRWATG